MSTFPHVPYDSSGQHGERQCDERRSMQVNPPTAAYNGGGNSCREYVPREEVMDFLRDYQRLVGLMKEMDFILRR